ncbi:MAG: glycosyl hydrolase family 28-related protein [Pseudomonadota bacterium]
MNIAVTDGAVLMPPAFVDGLNVWSSEDGTPGSATYASAGNVNLIAADSDFGPCLEMIKTQATQKLRYMGETPIPTGVYLEVKVRIKSISGPFPSVRIAGWAGGAGGAHVSGAIETGPTIALDTYGKVVEVSAIIGGGSRSGVDMKWGSDALYGHFGLDLTGATGSVVRIEDITIEDVTSFFLRDMIGIVDVTDYGAVPDGITDCVAAFEAADADAGGRTIFVPEGLFYLGNTVTLAHPVTFQGTVTMPVGAQLLLTRSFDFPSYADAFGNEELGFKKALQALFNFTDHDTLDLKGRRIELSGPVDVQASVDNKTQYATRRVLRNGQLNVQSSSAWDDDVVTKTATYATSSSYKLSNITDADQISVGSLVSGPGVGREIYVTSVDANAGDVWISNSLYGASGTQTYTFARFKYALDFSGFTKLQRFEVDGIDFQCNGRSSGLALALDGLVFQIRDCTFTHPKDRGVSSFSAGCAGLQIDRCQFYSNEIEDPAETRTSIGFNINENDTKIRNNRAIRFKHFGVFSGTGNLVANNHFFQEDNFGSTTRSAGFVFTRTNVKTTIIGNYVDNAFLEFNNEHDAEPDYNNTYSFGGITVTGNYFSASNVENWFSWIQVAPYGTGHFLNGLTISDNVFKISDGPWIDRVERVNTTYADLNHSLANNVVMEGNNFFKISYRASNPLRVKFDEGSAKSTWTKDVENEVPFGGQIHHVESFAPDGPLQSGSGTVRSDLPYFETTGSSSTTLNVKWPASTKGVLYCSVRCDSVI